MDFHLHIIAELRQINRIDVFRGVARGPHRGNLRRRRLEAGWFCRDRGRMPILGYDGYRVRRWGGGPRRSL